MIHHLHDIDFLSPDGRKLLADIGMSIPEMLEVQLVSLSMVATSPAANAVAHMAPPQEVVDTVMGDGDGVGIFAALFGEKVLAESAFQAAKDVLHVTCSLGSLIESMVTENVIDKARAEANLQKLTDAVNSQAARRNVH